MSDYLVEITYGLRDSDERHTDVVEMSDCYSDEEVEVMVRLHARQKIPLDVRWRKLIEDERG